MAFESFPSNRLPAPLANAVNHFLQIDRLEALYARASAEQGFVRRLLDDLEVRVNVSPADFEKIPATGAVVALRTTPSEFWTASCWPICCHVCVRTFAF